MTDYFKTPVVFVLYFYLQSLCKFGYSRGIHWTDLWEPSVSINRSEETHCRFCNEPLPCWKNALFPGSTPPANIKPILRVGIRGVDYYIEPKPGKAGLEEFKRTLRSFCELDDEADFDMSFGCSLPDPSGTLCAQVDDLSST
jgi:hypothetical protein